MKTIETSTNLIPCLDVATYSGHCEPDYVLSSSLDELSIKMQSKYWELFNNSKYMEMIFKSAKSYIESDIKDFLTDLNLGIKDVKAVKIHSPREYNFETDQIYFNLIVTKDFDKRLVKWIKANDSNEAFLEYIADRYTSYSGFMSFTPNNPSGLIEQMGKEIERCSGAVLSYLIQENKDEWQQDFLEAVNQDAFYTEFLPDNEESDKFMHRVNVHLTVNEVI